MPLKMEASPAHVNPAPTHNAQSRKRAAVSPAGPDDSKKQRGRPRVDPRDKTQADRRRTQIRLAQRTYRARKEYTINHLEDKVARLEAIIHRANVSVLELYHSAAESGSASNSPRYLQKLSKVSKDLAAAAATAEIADGGFRSSDSSPSSQHAPSSSCFASKRSTPGKQGPTPPPSDQSSADDAPASWASNGTLPTSTKAPAPTISSLGVRGVPSVLGYEIISQAFEQTDMPREYEQHEADQGGQANHAEQHYGTMLHHAPPQTPHTFHPAMLNHSPLRSLPLPSSVADQERSLSRFFHRACLEYACLVMHRPDSHPDIISRIFSHPLRYSTLSDIAKRLQSRLMASSSEDLHAKIPYRQDPAKQGDLQVVVYPDGTREQYLEGPWLGPEDVEMYFKARGITLNPAAQVAECDSAYEEAAPDHCGDFDESVADPVSRGWITDYPADSQGGMLALGRSSGCLPGVQLSHGRAASKPRKRMKIDVQRLLNAVILASCCRGPNPAVLMQDLDQAFSSSILSSQTY